MKLRILAAFFIGASAITQAAPPAEPDLYVADMRMKEWNDWKFGLFIHWGPWSKTSIGYIWKIVLEDPPGVREKRFELYRTFDPVQFEPKKWARAARNAGMKYVVFVTKHHDGFNNYNTALSDFRITGPASPFANNPNADLTKAVIDAFRAEGLAIGLYYSHIDWHHPDGRFFSRGHWDFDPSRVDQDPAAWKRFVNYEKGQVKELLTKYGKIDILWFDLFWPYAYYDLQGIGHPRVRADMIDLLNMVKTLQPDIIFNDRGTDVYGAFRTPEQTIPDSGFPGYWESNITLTNGRGFWFKGPDASSKTPAEIVRTLVSVVSKGGNFLLNVGPDGQGNLTEGEYAGLEGVGAWLNINGESIYGTSRGGLPNAPWGTSTVKGNKLFLLVTDWPKNGKIQVPGLRTGIKRAYLLADPNRSTLPSSDYFGGKELAVPANAPDAVCSVIALEFDGPPEIDNEIAHRALTPSPAIATIGVQGTESTVRETQG